MANHNTQSDLELCDLLRTGNYAAFTEIYKRYSLLLFNHAYNKCRDRDQAKDVVQEVFTSLWEKREVQQINRNLFSYLASATRYSVLNSFKHKQVEDKYISSLLDFVSRVSYDNDTDHLIRKKQLQARIEKEIEALPPGMREVFKMCRIQGLTHKQIAKALGIAEKTVTRQVSNALFRLRIKLPFFIIFLWIGRP